MVRKTISMPDEMGDWIARQMSAGRYNNESEYVRDLIRRDQEEQLKLDHLRSAIAQGAADIEAGRYTPMESAQDIAATLRSVRSESAS